MNLSLGAGGAGGFSVLCEDGERVLCRGWRDDGDGDRKAVLAVLSAAEHPTPGFIDRLAHEYALKDELDGRSAVRPLALVREHGRTMLLLEDPGGEPLDRLLGRPLEIGRFLRFAIGLSAALRPVYTSGASSIRTSSRPTCSLTSRAARLAQRASASPRVCRASARRPRPPEFIAGTLAYMAPEQTGRMNRSIDSRSDLYALGVTFYEMLTGALPFTAADPMEWVHCHIARQPTAAGERIDGIPGPLSAIVMKLLAKTAEERYQTAAGLEADLRRCLAEWEAHGRIEPFPLGDARRAGPAADPGEALRPRARDRRPCSPPSIGSWPTARRSWCSSPAIPASASPRWSTSCTRRSSRRAASSPRASSTSTSATSPTPPWPRPSRASCASSWAGARRSSAGGATALSEALGPNGQLIVDLVPELELIIGDAAAGPGPAAAGRAEPLPAGVPALHRRLRAAGAPARALPRRFAMAGRGDARPARASGHAPGGAAPAAGRRLPGQRGQSLSPAAADAEAIRKAGGRVQEIVLAPLGLDDVGQLVADALHCEPERARPLAQLVQEKTGGNPFFAIQFLTALAEEGLLAFDPVARAWRWDIDRIRARSYTDNVVDLMAGKLKRLSATTQEALKQLACLGNVAEIATLALVHGKTEEAMHAALWEAVRAGLVFRTRTPTGSCTTASSRRPIH